LLFNIMALVRASTPSFAGSLCLLLEHIYNIENSLKKQMSHILDSIVTVVLLLVGVLMLGSIFFNDLSEKGIDLR